MWHYLNDNLEHCTCSPDVVEASSPISSSDSDASVLSRLIPTAGMSCSHDSETEFSSSSLSGRMCATLTDTPGGVLLTASPAASRVLTSVLRAKVQASQANKVDSGASLPGSLAKFDPDTCSWRTYQRCLDGGWELFSATFPAWGMMRSGELYRLRTLVHRISGNGCGYWPTATVNGNYNRKGASKNSGDGLRTAVQAGRWLTPGTVQIEPTEGRQAKRTAYRASVGRHDVPGCLAEQVIRFPTPRAEDPEQTGVHGRCLQEEARMFPTAGATDWKGSSKLGQRRGQLSEVAVGGSLNPLWVGWLMGFPIGFSDSAPLATHKSLCPPHSHFDYWLDCCRRMLDELF